MILEDDLIQGLTFVEIPVYLEITSCQQMFWLEISINL